MSTTKHEAAARCEHQIQILSRVDQIWNTKKSDREFQSSIIKGGASVFGVWLCGAVLEKIHALNRLGDLFTAWGARAQQCG